MGSNIVELYWKEVFKQMEHPETRKGQALFNTLYMLHPGVANIIRNTDLDPFYKRDGELNEFIDRLPDLLIVGTKNGAV